VACRGRGVWDDGPGGKELRRAFGTRKKTGPVSGNPASKGELKKREEPAWKSKCLRGLRGDGSNTIDALSIGY